MSNCIAYSKPGQDLFVTFTNAWYIWGVLGVGLFLLFLGHACASVLIYFHIFSRIWCILTSITLRKPCSCFSPPFPFQFSPILPPFFPLTRPWEFNHCLMLVKPFLCVFIWEGWAPGCYCMSLKWCRCYRFHRRPWMLNESEAEWRRMVGRWVRVWAHMVKAGAALEL